MQEKFSIHRLGDSFAREGRENHKRVYEIKADKEPIILNIYTKDSEWVRRHFEMNLLFMKEGNKRNLAVPELLYYNEKDMVLAMAHGGERLDLWLKKATEEKAKEAIQQCKDAILTFADIKKHKSSPVFPRPFEKMFEVKKEKGFSDASPITQKEIDKFILKIKGLFKILEGNKYNYGLGRIDDDLINFAIDKKGVVRTFDFDGGRESYDPYYVLGYFWASLGRVEEKRDKLREYFLDILDLSREDKNIRFFLGVASAMSIGIFTAPTENRKIQKRIKDIYKIAEDFDVNL